MDYKLQTDEQLAEIAKTGDSVAMEILLNRSRQMVLSLARSYFLTGGETQDLVQEGMIAVFRAVSSFNGKASFKSYAYLCVKTAIISVVKKNMSDKQKPLTNYVSLSGCVDFDADKTDLVLDENNQPEKEYIKKESMLELKKDIKQKLSPLEYEIFSLYLRGYSYDEIANIVNKKIKSIDNAIQRIRKKLSFAYNKAC